MIRRGTAVPGLLGDEWDGISQFELPGSNMPTPPMPMAKPQPNMMNSLSPIMAAAGTARQSMPTPMAPPQPAAMPIAQPAAPQKSMGRGILDWLNEPIGQDRGLLDTAREIGVDTEGAGMSRGMYAARALKGFADGMSSSLYDDIPGNFMGRGQMSNEMLAAGQENNEMLRQQIADRVSIMRAKQTDAKATRPVVVPPGASLRDIEGHELYSNPAAAKGSSVAPSETEKLLNALKTATPEQAKTIQARLSMLTTRPPPSNTSINLPWIGKDDAGNLLSVPRDGSAPTTIAEAKPPGPVKPTPTELKLKAEAERMVSVGSGNRADIERAIELNDVVPDGYESIVQKGVDYFTNKERYADTQEYDQLVKATLLPRMKEIFGANPTEGERAALLELGAIGSMSGPARKAALERAHREMQTAVERNRRMAQGIADGTYRSTAILPEGETEEAPEEEENEDEEEEDEDLPSGFRVVN